MIINTNSKRTKGKRKADICLPEFYEHYCNICESKGKKPVDFKVYSDIIKCTNLAIRDTIVYDNELIRMPYRLGKLGILKYEARFDDDKRRFWSANYQKSKELGFIVYYDDPYKYKWKWDKSVSRIVGTRDYLYLPCRTASRLIAKAKRENKNLDYCTTIKH